MIIVNAHVFQSEQAAQSAISAINQHFGVPVSEDAITQNWTTYQQKGEEQIWYIEVTDDTIDVLGFSNIQQIEIEDDLQNF